MAEAARNQVLLTPELLELVLLALPVRDLLVHAQLVSRTWKAAIDSSQSLQEALFFRPSTARGQQRQQRSVTFNPLLQEAFPPWFRPDTKPVLRGPAVVKNCPWAAVGDDSDRRRKAFMRREASWRRMLPCQPAKRVLEVAGKRNDRRGIYETNGTVEFGPEGIRMGTLYDLGIDAARVYATTFWILWDEEGREGEGRVTMFVHRSWFKSGPGMPPDIADEYLSEGREGELAIVMREERRGMMWHAGFGNPPKGGWLLRVPSVPPQASGEDVQ